MKEWPKVGKLVVCSVREVKEWGAMVYLDEYEKEGFVHLSQIAPGWIKYIRDYIREGQKVVCRVLSVDTKMERIDLSLKDVSERERKEKIRKWKDERKALKLLSMAVSQERISEVKEKLSSYEEIYPVLEEAAKDPEILLDSGIDEETALRIHEIASENIKIPEVSIGGYLELSCPSPDGVEVIRRALMAAVSQRDTKAKVEITYIGAPRYRIKVRAPDYRKAEAVLKKATNSAIKIVEKFDGSGSFIRK
jgi:translation initiation factor 2 subunit 1